MGGGTRNDSAIRSEYDHLRYLAQKAGKQKPATNPNHKNSRTSNSIKVNDNGQQMSMNNIKMSVKEMAASDQEFATAAALMAADLHTQWQEGYAANPANHNEDGSLKPRNKETTDLEWAERTGAEILTDADGNKYAIVDIAHTDYEDLPKDKQKDNKEAALAAVGIVAAGLGREEDVDSEEFLERAAAMVHQEWMKRTKKEEGYNDHLFVPYSELPEEEKEKDRVHIRAALDKVEALADDDKSSDNIKFKIFGKEFGGKTAVAELKPDEPRNSSLGRIPDSVTAGELEKIGLELTLANHYEGMTYDAEKFKAAVAKATADGDTEALEVLDRLANWSGSGDRYGSADGETVEMSTARNARNKERSWGGNPTDANEHNGGNPNIPTPLVNETAQEMIGAMTDAELLKTVKDTNSAATHGERNYGDYDGGDRMRESLKPLYEEIERRGLETDAEKSAKAAGAAAPRIEAEKKAKAAEKAITDAQAKVSRLSDTEIAASIGLSAEVPEGQYVGPNSDFRYASDEEKAVAVKEYVEWKKAVDTEREKLKTEAGIPADEKPAKPKVSVPRQYEPEAMKAMDDAQIMASLTEKQKQIDDKEEYSPTDPDNLLPRKAYDELKTEAETRGLVVPFTGFFAGEKSLTVEQLSTLKDDVLLKALADRDKSSGEIGRGDSYGIGPALSADFRREADQLRAEAVSRGLVSLPKDGPVYSPKKIGKMTDEEVTAELVRKEDERSGKGTYDPGDPDGTVSERARSEIMAEAVRRGIELPKPTYEGGGFSYAPEQLSAVRDDILLKELYEEDRKNPAYSVAEPLRKEAIRRGLVTLPVAGPVYEPEKLAVMKDKALLAEITKLDASVDTYNPGDPKNNIPRQAAQELRAEAITRGVIAPPCSFETSGPSYEPGQLSVVKDDVLLDELKKMDLASREKNSAYFVRPAADALREEAQSRGLIGKLPKEPEDKTSNNMKLMGVQIGKKKEAEMSDGEIAERLGLSSQQPSGADTGPNSSYRYDSKEIKAKANQEFWDWQNAVNAERTKLQTEEKEKSQATAKIIEAKKTEKRTKAAEKLIAKGNPDKLSDADIAKTLGYNPEMVGENSWARNIPGAFEARDQVQDTRMAMRQRAEHEANVKNAPKFRSETVDAAGRLKIKTIADLPKVDVSKPEQVAEQLRWTYIGTNDEQDSISKDLGLARPVFKGSRRDDDDPVYDREYPIWKSKVQAEQIRRTSKEIGDVKALQKKEWEIVKKEHPNFDLDDMESEVNNRLRTKISQKLGVEIPPRPRKSLAAAISDGSIISERELGNAAADERRYREWQLLISAVSGGTVPEFMSYEQNSSSPTSTQVKAEKKASKKKAQFEDWKGDHSL